MNLQYIIYLCILLFWKKRRQKSALFPPPTTILKTIFSNYDIKEFSKVEILFGIFSLREKPSCRLFLVLAFSSDSLTRIKRFAPLHSLTHIFFFEKTLEVTSFRSSPSGRLMPMVQRNF
jgi:hypothetical protein